MMAEMPPEQDYDAVIRKELRDAQRFGSAGLIRFIARNPDHPLANEARHLLAEHTEAMRPIPGDSDADVARAFDTARRSNSAEALAAFAGRYRGHPLAAEALRMRDAIDGR